VCGKRKEENENGPNGHAHPTRKTRERQQESRKKSVVEDLVVLGKELNLPPFPPRF